jgi:hypothetical protein
LVKGKIIYLLLVLFGLGTAFFYHHIQPSINYRLNPLADGNEYEKIYDHFRGENPEYQVRYGIHSRVLIPYLASLLPFKNTAQNFFMINTILAVLSLTGLYFLMQTFGISDQMLVYSVLFFSLHYVGPFRQNALDPINVDMGVYLLEIVFLFLFIEKKYVWLLILVPPAVAVKEVFLALIVVFCVIAVLRRLLYHDNAGSMWWIFAALMLGMISKAALNYYFPSVSPERNSLLVMAFHLREMWLHPEHALRWILALFAAFGPVLFLMIKKPNFAVLDKKDLSVIILSAAVLALSFLGGMDYTRLIFLGFPYIIIAVLKICRPKKNELLLAFFLSLILTRFWMVLPEMKGDITAYNAWMPEYADSKSLLYWTFSVLFFLMLYFGIIFFWQRITRRDHIAE